MPLPARHKRHVTRASIFHHHSTTFLTTTPRSKRRKRLLAGSCYHPNIIIIIICYIHVPRAQVKVKTVCNFIGAPFFKRAISERSLSHYQKQKFRITKELIFLLDNTAHGELVELAEIRFHSMTRKVMRMYDSPNQSMAAGDIFSSADKSH